MKFAQRELCHFLCDWTNDKMFDLDEFNDVSEGGGMVIVSFDSR